MSLLAQFREKRFKMFQCPPHRERRLKQDVVVFHLLGKVEAHAPFELPREIEKRMPPDAIALLDRDASGKALNLPRVETHHSVANEEALHEEFN